MFMARAAGKVPGARLGSLAGQVAVVTGSGGAMGGAIAERLAAAGAHIVLNDRVAHRVDEDGHRTVLGGDPLDEGIDTVQVGEIEHDLVQSAATGVRHVFAAGRQGGRVAVNRDDDGAEAGEQPGGSPADPGRRARDESDPAGEGVLGESGA